MFGVTFLAQLLPEHDSNPNYLKTYDQEKHYDIDIDYDLINTRVSMRWRPRIYETAIADLKDWTTPPYNNAPDFILFGKLINIGFHLLID